MQQWMLWALLWTAESYAPSRAQNALSLGTSQELLASDFVKMLNEASSNAGVPSSWPHIALDADKAKLLMDVEHARILLWKEWALQQQPCAAVEGQSIQSHLRGGRPQAAKKVSNWCCESLGLALILLTLSLAPFAGRLARGWRLSFSVPCGTCQAELLPTSQKMLQSTVDFPNLLCSSRQDICQQAESGSCGPFKAVSDFGDGPQRQQCSASQDANSCVDVPSKMLDNTIVKPLAWMGDAGKQPWSDARHSSRFMLQTQAWSEVFDQAYLGVVEEFEDVIASGFGGTVRQGRWADFLVASKQFHRGDDELFSELYYSLLVGPSPTLGFATTPEGHPRLISAWLPETSAQHVRRMSWSPETSKRFVCDMLAATLCMHACGLVHCDLKPDNIMVGVDGAVYLIDYGSTSRPGDQAPMSCGAFRPPEGFVSCAWDVYSLGLILQMLHQEGLDLCACGKAMYVDMCAEMAEQRPTLHQCILTLPHCACIGKAIGTLEA